MEKVSVQDSSSGELIEVDKPIGTLCLRCTSGCRAGMPYLSEEALQHAVRASTETKELAKKIVDIHHGNTPAVFDNAVSTDTRQSTQTFIDRLSDGFTRDDFPDAHQGLSPEDLHMTGKPHFCKVSGQQFDEVFFTPGRPQFRLVERQLLEANLTKNQMLRQVYTEQPDHTFQYNSENRIGKLFEHSDTCPYLSRASFDKAVKDAVQTKGIGSRRSDSRLQQQHATVGGNGNPFARPQPAVQAIQSRQSAPVKAEAMSGAGVPKAPAVKFTAVKSEPMAGKAEAHMPPAQATAAKSAPPVPSAPLSSAPPAKSIPPVPSALFIRNGAASKRPPSITAAKAGPYSQRPRMTADAPASADKQHSDAAGSQSRASVVNLAKPRDVAQGDVDASTSCEGLKGMDKFQRAKARVDLIKILLGHNMEAELSNLRKMKTTAIRECPIVAQDLSNHEESAAGTAQLRIEHMVKQKVFEILVQIADKVAKSLEAGKLPKFSFCDFCLVSVAMQTLSPWQPKADLMEFLKRLPLVCDLKGEYDHKTPSWDCSYFDFDDLATGVIPTRFCQFIEKYILRVYIAAGEHHRQTIVTFITEGLLPKIAALPETHSAPCYRQMKQRCQGLLFMIGQIRGIANCELAHAEFLKSCTGNPILAACQCTKWTKTLLDTLYVVHAGEKAAWPHVEKFVKDFADTAGVPGKQEHVQELILKYPAWKLQCRPGSLQFYVHPVALKWFGERIAEKDLKPADPNGIKFDPADVENSWILEKLRALKALGWAEAPINIALEQMANLAKAIENNSNSAKLVQLFKSFAIGDSEELKAIVEFGNSVVSVMPKGTGAVRIPSADRKECIPVFASVGALCLKVWPRDEMFAPVGFLLDRCELPQDPPLDGEHEQQSLQTCRSDLRTFRRLQGYWRHLEMFKRDAAKLSHEFVENTATIELCKKLIAYHKFFAEFDVNTLTEEGPRGTFTASMSTLEAGIKEFKTYYIANAYRPLRSALAELLALKGGAKEGKVWSDLITAGCVWSVFFSETSETLRKVDKNKLVLSVQATAAVWHF